MKIWIVLGSLSAFLSVAFGAFGAHALSGKISERALEIFHTAAQYQMYHALALLAFGLYMSTHPTSTNQVVGWAFTIGTVLFSGSLYALALTDIKILGAITPLGGLSFMVGWITFAIQAWKA